MRKKYKYEIVAEKILEDFSFNSTEEDFPSIDFLRRRYKVGTGTVQKSIEFIREFKAGEKKRAEPLGGSDLSIYSPGVSKSSDCVNKTILIKSTEDFSFKKSAWKELVELFSVFYPYCNIKISYINDETEKEPDIIINSYPVLKSLSVEGKLINLSDYLCLDKIISDTFLPIKSLFVNNKHILESCPVHLCIPVTIYNADLPVLVKEFAHKKDLFVEEIPFILEKLYADGWDKLGCYFHGDASSLLTQKKFSLIQEIDQVDISKEDREKIKEVLILLRKLRNISKGSFIHSGSVSRNNGHIFSPLIEKQAAFLTTTSSFMPNLRNYSGVNWQLTAFPRFPETPISMETIEIGIMKDSKNIFEALEFIKLASGRQGQKIFASHAILPTIENIANSKFFSPSENENKAIQIKTAQGGELRAITYEPIIHKLLQNILFPRLLESVFGDRDFDETISDAIDSMSLYVKLNSSA